MKSLKKLVMEGVVELEGDLSEDLTEAWGSLIEVLREEIIFDSVSDLQEEIDMERAFELLPDYNMAATLISVVAGTATIELELEGPEASLHGILKVDEEE